MAQVAAVVQVANVSLDETPAQKLPNAVSMAKKKKKKIKKRKKEKENISMILYKPYNTVGKKKKHIY